MISKLPDIGTTIFTVMSALAAEHKAINLSQGFPDYDCSDELKALVNEAMQQGYNQYAPMPGVPALRSAIASKISSLYAQNIHPDTEITITPGGTCAIFTAITTCIHPGDEVIIFEPAYDSYIPNVLVNGGKPGTDTAFIPVIPHQLGGSAQQDHPTYQNDHDQYTA